MQKVTRIIGAICMMGLLTFVSTSCKKEKENGEMTINVTVSEWEEDGERAYIDEAKRFWWHENDYIRVYNLAEDASESATSVFTKIGGESTQTARFRGPSVGAKKDVGYRVFYPIDMVKGTTDYINLTLANENRQTFVLSDEQQFHYYKLVDETGKIIHHTSMVDPVAMPLAVAPDKLTDNVTLKQMFGVASFNINALAGSDLVLTKAVLTDKKHNLSGEITVRLDMVDDTDLQDACDAFFATYHGYTDDFISGVLLPLEAGIFWDPDTLTTSKTITLNCVYEHQNGDVCGETVVSSGYTKLNFLVRPLALCEGFTLELYFANHDVITLDETNFTWNDTESYYGWATAPKKLKNYLVKLPINYGE